MTTCKPGLTSHVGGILLTAGQPAHSSTNLGHAMSLPGDGGTSGLHDKSCHTCGHKMSLLWVSLLDAVPNLSMRCLSWEWGAHLTKGQPAYHSTKLGHEMSLPVGYFSPYQYFCTYFVTGNAWHR